jgi:hypothetical protein
MIPIHRANQGAMHFALRWELLMFADEYEVRPLLLLWDNLLLHHDHYREFMYALCIAHAVQIPQPVGDELAIVVAQRFRGWDVRAAIEFAETFRRRDAHLRGKSIQLVAGIVGALAILLFLRNWLW